MMQLTIPFSDLDDTTLRPENHSANAYMNEFRQGNFSHILWQTRYSIKELMHTLLTSSATLDTVKESLLESIAEDIWKIEQELNDDYKEYARGHNHELRDRLAYRFGKEDIGKLKKLGLRKFHKYNDVYREMHGGKHFNTISVTDPDHEWHDRYLTRRRKHMQYCVSQLMLSDVHNKNNISQYYASIFPTKEFIEEIYAMDIPQEQKKILSEQALADYAYSAYYYDLIRLVCTINLSEDQKDLIVEWISKDAKLSYDAKESILKEIQKRRNLS